MSNSRKRNRSNYAYPPAGAYRNRAPKGSASGKTLAILSVCAVILGIMITAHDYLDTHSAAAADAQAVLTESLSTAAVEVRKYAEAVRAEDTAKASEADKLATARASEADKLADTADAMSSDDFTVQNRAYLTVASALNDPAASGTAASSKEAKALADALSDVHEAADAYNREAAALNDKVNAFPYNLIAKTAGYRELPVFELDESTK